jgi:hypothetical protein
MTSFNMSAPARPVKNENDDKVKHPWNQFRKHCNPSTKLELISWDPYLSPILENATS